MRATKKYNDDDQDKLSFPKLRFSFNKTTLQELGSES